MTQIEIITLILSGSALIVSGALFFVHSKNQAERRTKELTDLRRTILTTLQNFESRLNNSKSNLELARIALRHTEDSEDSEDKYNCIEMMPDIIATTEELLSKITKHKENILKLKLESANYTTLNKTLDEITIEITDANESYVKTEKLASQLLEDINNEKSY